MTRFFRYMTLAAIAAPVCAMAQQAPAVRLASATRASTTLAPAVADTAIDQLESFLGRYPNSPLRANALFQLGELLVKRADEQFAAQQRTTTGDTTSRSDAPARPNYAEAIGRYEELVRRFPNFQQIDAAAYTLGTLYTQNQRYADAARMFQIVAGRDSSRFQSEALFRLGDADFELAAKEKGATRVGLFAQAANAYERAVAGAPHNGDIYFLSLYKLGWSYYNQATQTNQAAYQKATDVFGRLIDAYDKLTPEQQARLGLRGEAIEYMAVAFTQVGGAEAANRYFSQPGRGQYKIPVLRRVAQGLRDQGSFPQAVEAYQALITEAPTDSSSLAAQREIVDIYQNRTLEQPKAQEARLALVEKFAPNSEWARANPALATEAAKAREEALRQSAQYLLADAQKSNNKARFGEAAGLYQRYLSEFQNSDSARAVNSYYAEALFGQGDYQAAGAAYSRAAYGFSAQAAPRPDSATATRRDSTAAGRRSARDSAPLSFAEQAGRNAIVAYDSALVRAKGDRGAQDSLFASIDRFVQTFPQSDIAKRALITKGKRASESQRWDVMAATFRTYAERYPTDPYTPTAQKLIGDALYKQGQYAEAQTQWETAQGIASQSGRRALADTIASTRATAADLFADTLIKRGEYARAAEEVYVAFADKNPQSPKTPDALRNAIETYMVVVDSARQKGKSDEDVKQARDRAIALTQRLVTTFPNYKYRSQYQNLNARLLAESGRRDEAITALRSIVDATPRGAAQADAMIRLAVSLDSAGQKKEAAAAYERFAAAYPTEKRAPDAQYNAAVTYIEAGDTATAVRSYATFASRFPRDPRAGQARELRVALLRASGDTATASAELSKLCANPTSNAVRAECSGRNAKRLFDIAVGTFGEYQQERLVIPSIKQLTAAGVKRASARKQALLRQLSAQFQAAIRTGNAEYVAASTYYLGLAQNEYGDFIKNVRLPEGLTPEQTAAAQSGSAQQAQQYYDAAKGVWQALIDKAEQDTTLKNDPKAGEWIAKAREAISAAPSASAPAATPAQPPATPPDTQPATTPPATTQPATTPPATTPPTTTPPPATPPTTPPPGAPGTTDEGR